MVYVIRLIFLLLVAAVVWAYSMQAVASAVTQNNATTYYILVGGAIAAFGVIALDVAFPKKNLKALSGVMFGVLVGVLISVCIGYMTDQITQMFVLQRVPLNPTPDDPVVAYNHSILNLVQGLKILLGLIITYVTVSFILQTKDDFRFIIPYVEFARAAKGPRP